MSLESESERERRKTAASPSLCLPQSGSQGSTIPSPPEDDEEEDNDDPLLSGSGDVSKDPSDPLALEQSLDFQGGITEAWRIF